MKALSIAVVSQPRRAEGRTDRQTAPACTHRSPTAGETAGSAWAPPRSVPALLPTQAALHSHGTQTASHTRAGSADSASDAAHAYGWHSTRSPLPLPSAPPQTRLVQPQGAGAEGIAGTRCPLRATSPLSKPELLGGCWGGRGKGLLPGDRVAGEGTVVPPSSTRLEADWHSLARASRDPQHRSTDPPLHPCPYRQPWRSPLIPAKARTFPLC